MFSPVEHPFSCGTEGMDWQEVWCNECVHDHAFHDANNWSDGGCPVFMQALLGEPVPEWDSYQDEQGYGIIPAPIVCRSFSQCQACPEGVVRDGLNRTHRAWAAEMRSLAPVAFVRR